MGKVIQLNRFRKQKAKADKQRKAETNRRLHGRTNQERQKEAADKQRLLKAVEQARLDPKTDQSEDASSQHILSETDATLNALEILTESAPTLGELSESIKEKKGAHLPDSDD